jgi:hypothetical protein
MFSSVPALMAEPTHDPGQALLYIIISGDSLPQIQLSICNEAFARVELSVPRGHTVCSVAAAQQADRSGCLFLCSHPDGFRGYHVWAHAGLGALVERLFDIFCTVAYSLMHVLICLLPCTDEHGRRRPRGTWYLNTHAVRCCTGSLPHR